jgi:hypothetical protein
MNELIAHRLSEYVAALQLLIGDLPADSRVFIMREAFPDIVVLAHGDQAERACRVIARAAYHISNASGIVDGSSGLGAVAARNAAAMIAGANGNLLEAMGLLNIREET